MEPAKRDNSGPGHLQSAIAHLSPMEQKAVVGVVGGKSKTQAIMIDADYSESTANKRQQMVFGRERVQDALMAALESAGITPDTLAGLMKDGLEATRVLGMKSSGESSGNCGAWALSRGIFGEGRQVMRKGNSWVFLAWVMEWRYGALLPDMNEGMSLRCGFPFPEGAG